MIRNHPLHSFAVRPAPVEDPTQRPASLDLLPGQWQLRDGSGRRVCDNYEDLYPQHAVLLMPTVSASRSASPAPETRPGRPGGLLLGDRFGAAA